MVPVKICGITNLSDALDCIRLGANAVGFVFAESKRMVYPNRAAEIARELPPFITKTGVFVDESPDRIKAIMKDCRLDLAQLHGDEPPDYVEYLEGRVIKAFKAGFSKIDPLWGKVSLRGVLVDTYSPSTAGGTGEPFEWRLVEDYRRIGCPVILAGGLNPANIRLAIETARPDGVDVSSGVEREPGKKDPEKVRRFIEILRQLG